MSELISTTTAPTRRRSGAGREAPRTHRSCSDDVVASRRRRHRNRRRALPGRVRHLGRIQPREQPPGREPFPPRDACTTSATSCTTRSADTGGKPDAPYLRWLLNSMLVAAPTALLTTLLGALAAYAFSRFRFKGAPHGDAGPAADPDVPAVRRDRRDLPARLQPRRHLPAARAQLAARGDRRLPRRRDGRAGLADEGLLRHDPDRAGRVGARRRRDAGADLLGRRPAARGARARRRRADLVRLHAERVRDRVGAAPDEEPLHAAGRAAASSTTSTASTGGRSPPGR